MLGIVPASLQIWNSVCSSGALFPLGCLWLSVCPSQNYSC